MTARAWFFFGSVSILWGMPYFFIKIALDDGLSPIFVAWARVALGAALLVVVVWRAGLFASLRGRWRWVLAYTAVEIAIPFPLIAWGEERVSSSVTAILIASVPLIIAVMALRVDRTETATGTRLVGLLLGFGGVIALVGLDVAGTPAELVGAAAILLAAVGYGIGPFVLKNGFGGVDPRAIMAGALAIATVVLTPFAAVNLPSQTPPVGTIAALVALGTVCTAAALVFFAGLVAEVGPGRASVTTYVAPVVAVSLGVAVLGERPGAGAVAGMLLIIAGSWLSTDGRLPPGFAAAFTRLRGTRRQGEAAGQPQPAPQAERTQAALS